MGCHSDTLPHCYDIETSHHTLYLPACRHARQNTRLQLISRVNQDLLIIRYCINFISRDWVAHHYTHLLLLNCFRNKQENTFLLHEEIHGLKKKLERAEQRVTEFNQTKTQLEVLFLLFCIFSVRTIRE